MRRRRRRRREARRSWPGLVIARHGSRDSHYERARTGAYSDPSFPRHSSSHSLYSPPLLSLSPFTTMSSAALPVVPLAYPLLLLPTARLTIPVSNAAGELLLDLVQEAEAPPVVAAIPVPSADASTLHEWGSAARIVRVVRPPRSLARDAQRPYLLTVHGLARIHIPEAHNPREKLDGLSERIVEYPNADGTASAETTATFKAAAIKLLDRLARDAPNDSKRDFYVKLSNMVDEVTTQRAPWLADMLVASLNTEYADKLGESLGVRSPLRPHAR